MEKIYQFLLGCPNIYVRSEAGPRRYLEAVLWMARSGALSRLLPTAYGKWNSIYKRLSNWCDTGQSHDIAEAEALKIGYNSEYVI